MCRRLWSAGCSLAPGSLLSATNKPTMRVDAVRASKSGSRTQLVRPSPCGHLVAVGPTAQQQHYQQHRQCRLGAAASETSLAGSGDASNAQAQSETEAHPIVGIVIVDHGSKKAEANEMLTQFTQMFKSGGEHQIVEMAHMELAEPSIKQAVHRCVQQGASHIVVAPYFLSRGRHVQNDIPQLAQEAVADLPNVHITVANPIGIDPLLAQLVGKRVQDAASSFV